MTGRIAVSVTLTPEILQAAQAITGTSDISQLFDDALGALIEREPEKRWVEANRDDDLPGEVRVDLSLAPWEEE